MSKEEKLKKVEDDISSLKNTLELCKEATPYAKSCSDLCEHSEKEDEPFSDSYQMPNVWQKNSGGGTCIIL